MRRALAASLGTLALLLGPTAAQAEFALEPGAAGFAAAALADGGAPASLAASHPYEFELSVGIVGGSGDLRRLQLDLPVGMLLNPRSASTCAAAAFNAPRSSPFDPGTETGEGCPAQSQIGTVEIESDRGGGEVRRFGAFNLEPPSGAAAAIGFAPYGVPVVLAAFLRDTGEGRYAIRLVANDIPQDLAAKRIALTLWGVPWATSHDTERGNCLNEADSGFPWAKCPAAVAVGTRPPAYLTLPGECAPALTVSLRVSAWRQGGEVSREAANESSPGNPQPLLDCESLPFAPAVGVSLTNRRASAPSGFGFSVEADQAGLTEPSWRAPAPAREIRLTLPEGVTVNTAVGAGLGACSPARFAAESPFNGQGGPGCPNAAKIGAFTARTPLFAKDIEGAVYLAEPDNPATPAPGAENPFDSLIAVYLVAKLGERGMIVKAAGEVAANEASGRLVAGFKHLPSLPYSRLQLDLRHGQRPFLATPPSCGSAISRIRLEPAAGAAQEVTRSWAIDMGAEGPCPTGAIQPFSPNVVTGGVNAHVGSYTPYFVRISRRDAEQELTGYSLVLPKGVTGKLAGIPFCPEAAIAAARANGGFAETERPSCPAASRVGGALTGYGVGGALAYSPGQIYLAGPYGGQPLSLVIVNAATVGPFDLGTYVIRAAFAVDPLTAQLRIDPGASDPIPHIVQGIPLHVREIRVSIDRHEFTHNPSSCAPAELVSTLRGSGARLDDPADDASVTISRHFQLLNCRVLGFRPRLGIHLRGGMRRSQHPSLRATYASRGPQDSNIKRIEVVTPPSMFLAHDHIRQICTRAQFAAEACPAGSVYGRVVAHTPLFDEPMRGEVYLRSSTNRLPDLVALLRSGEVRIELVGRISPSKGGVRAYFAEVPDAPIRRFTMTLYGGKRGLLENSDDVCRSNARVSVRAMAQNSIGAVFSPKVRGQCGGKAEAKGKRGSARQASSRKRGGASR